jgi:hypothetical protein
MRYLKQNTDSYISIGPALDKTAGFGNEDALTVTSFSGVIVKEVQSSACTYTDFTPSATAANDWGMVAIGYGGLYQLKIPDSEINFVGSATLAIWYDAEALPIWCEFMVVPANVWDSLMGTDLLDVSVTQIGGVAQSATDLKDFADTGYDPSTHLAQVDVTRLGGVAQSATDLKDFADTGYDPSTHKVAGVVLTDTCTTNTDMRGTNSAALASVCTETRLAELDAANLPKTTDDTLSDVVTAAAYIDTEVADILADTNEIQAELADGGRTDLLIDSIISAIAALENISVADIIAGIADGSYDLQEMMRVIFAVCSGKSDGGGTATLHFRNSADNKNRVTATVDADGNRTAITLDAS